MNTKARALLTPAVMLLATCSSALPLPNDSDVGLYFPDVRLNDKNILEKIKSFKKIGYPDAKSAEALIDIGLPALPYAIQLAGVRRSRFQFAFTAKYIGPHFAIERPYSSHAGLIVGEMRDSNARPILLKLINHPQLAYQAKKALVRMTEPVDYETMLHMLEKDSKGLDNAYLYKDIYSPLIRRLNSPERIKILSGLLGSRAFRFCLDMRGHGSGPGNDGLHDALIKLIEDLGDTHSPLLLQQLKNTLANVQEPRELDEPLRSDPHFIKVRQEELARVALLRESLQQAIAKSSRNLPVLHE